MQGDEVQCSGLSIHVWVFIFRFRIWSVLRFQVCRFSIEVWVFIVGYSGSGIQVQVFIFRFRILVRY